VGILSRRCADTPLRIGVLPATGDDPAVNAIRRLSALLVLALCATSCQLPRGPSGADVEAEPAFGLTFPGATELSRTRRDPFWGIDAGHTGARAARVLVADDAPDEVFRFYEQAWQADGWRPAHDFLTGNCAGILEHAWVKGDLAIALGWFDLFDIGDRDCGGVSPDVLESHASTFEVVIGWHENRELRSFEPRTTPTPDPIVEVLETLPEWDLSVHGSILLNQGRQRTTQEEDASISRRYRYDGPAQDVIAFYRQQLTDGGWNDGIESYDADVQTDLQVCGWHKDGTAFRLRIWDPAEWNRIFENLPYETVYEIRLYQEAAGNVARTACLAAGS
jgi:hypothetical protein